MTYQILDTKNLWIFRIIVFVMKCCPQKCCYSSTIYSLYTNRGRLSIKMSSDQYSYPILKIRRSHDRLIFDMRMPYLEKTVFILRRCAGSCASFSCSQVALVWSKQDSNGLQQLLIPDIDVTTPGYRRQGIRTTKFWYLKNTPIK